MLKESSYDPLQMAARLTVLAAAAALALMLVGGASGATNGTRADRSTRSARTAPRGRSSCASTRPCTCSYDRRTGRRSLSPATSSWGTCTSATSPAGRGQWRSTHPVTRRSHRTARGSRSRRARALRRQHGRHGLRLIADRGVRPSWSPSGTRIAYGLGHAGHNGYLWDSEIHVANVDGGDRRHDRARAVSPMGAARQPDRISRAPRRIRRSVLRRFRRVAQDVLSRLFRERRDRMVA